MPHTAAIERLQPYDPDKTVVLVIHGLMDFSGDMGADDQQAAR